MRKKRNWLISRIFARKKDSVFLYPFKGKPKKKKMLKAIDVQKTHFRVASHYYPCIHIVLWGPLFNLLF